MGDRFCEKKHNQYVNVQDFQPKKLYCHNLQQTNLSIKQFYVTNLKVCQ